MRYIVPRKQPFAFPEDVDRIVKICFEADYIITRDDAEQIWREYSDMLAANWLTLPRANPAIVAIMLKMGNIKEDQHA